jgi:hypothetical protein
LHLKMTSLPTMIFLETGKPPGVVG